SDAAPAGEHLKAKTPRVYGAIRAASAARRAVKSPRLIEAAGQPDSGAGQALAFCGQCRQRAALAAAEGDPRPSVLIRRRQDGISRQLHKIKYRPAEKEHI
ncbi:hypothetical protein, partial [Bacillus amyloliquefaciens]|uniref:hypothetical protein n=1 Tax=Bacillus amyloliquefaciens TaxID=1390 RepID=UPI001CD58C53